MRRHKSIRHLFRPSFVTGPYLQRKFKWIGKALLFLAFVAVGLAVAGGPDGPAVYLGLAAIALAGAGSAFYAGRI